MKYAPDSPAEDVAVSRSVVADIVQGHSYDDLKNFNEQLETLPPHQRPGFIESFYIQHKDNNDPYYLLLLAALMGRWNAQLSKADFTPHIERLRNLAKNAARQEAEIGCVMVRTRRKIRDVFESAGLPNFLREQSIQ